MVVSLWVRDKVNSQTIYRYSGKRLDIKAALEQKIIRKASLPTEHFHLWNKILKYGNSD